MEKPASAIADSIIISRDEVVHTEKISEATTLEKLKSFFYEKRLFTFTVIIPTLLSLIYYGLIASDIYISESQFVVKTPHQQAPSMGLGMLFGSAMGASQNDSYSVSAFMLSRDALKEIDTKASFKKIYSDKKIDILNRFGSLEMNSTFEGLHRYYQKYVNILFDPTSSISTLKVQAFTSEDAKKINEILLKVAEIHINKLNERARHDLIQFSKNEMVTAEKFAKDTTHSLANYRNKNSLFDPAEFERLLFEKSFSLKQLEVRRAALVQANDEAVRQFLYLQRVVEPNSPDYAAEPRRVRNIFATLILGLICWGILSILISGVREHHD